jgi:hypothetical protein
MSKLKFNAVPDLVAAIAALPRSANCEFRIDVNLRYGKRYVSLGNWFKRKGGLGWWRREAIHFAPDELDAVLVALHKARNVIRMPQDVPEPPIPGDPMNGN